MLLRSTGMLSDRQIARLCRKSPPLIAPFKPNQSSKRPTSGLSSFGYDITLASNWLALHSDQVGNLPLDPHTLSAEHFGTLTGDRIAIPASSFVLASSVEWFHLPRDLLGLVLGKSSYARCGLVVNVTPMEPGWHGRLTLELVNPTSNRIIVHPGTGIAQVVFLRGTSPRLSYNEKASTPVYQDQQSATPPR